MSISSSAWPFWNPGEGQPGCSPFLPVPLDGCIEVCAPEPRDGLPRCTGSFSGTMTRSPAVTSALSQRSGCPGPARGLRCRGTCTPARWRCSPGERGPPSRETAWPAAQEKCKSPPHLHPPLPRLLSCEPLGPNPPWLPLPEGWEARGAPSGQGNLDHSFPLPLDGSRFMLRPLTHLLLLARCILTD